MTPPNTTGAQALSKHAGFCAYDHGGVFCKLCDQESIRVSREQAGAVAAAYLMTSASGATKWSLMPKDVTPEWRKVCAADGISIQPLYLAAPGAAVAAREQEATPADWKRRAMQSATPYCLGCEVEGHRTDECHSTHGFNSPHNMEIFRLAWGTLASREEAPEQSAKGLTMGGEDAA